MYDGLVKAMQVAFVAAFVFGGIAAALLYGLVRILIYVVSHLQWGGA